MPWFGLYLPQVRMPWERIVERAQAAEAAGFDSLWLMDHLVAPQAPEGRAGGGADRRGGEAVSAHAFDTYEGWTAAAALAACTSTIRIGHLVLCDPFRHPVLLAKMAATLDVISGGRLDLGIGWGSVPDELRAFGFGEDAPALRAARLRETLEILQRMFAGEPFDYDATDFQVRGAIGRPVPVQPRLPVHIGGGGARLTMPLVREFADWWNCPGYALDRLDRLRPLAGDARVSTQHPVGLAASAADRDDVIATTHRRFGSWGGVVAGTADEVAAALAREVDAGVEGFVLQFSDFGTPATLERFMSDVAPRLT
jgi:alkanesulfonate monooxygenase SsuD/methylene tetrahydromethanopterin reductase-like flavin-dependent oxidoreductase (luciferase family)